MAIAVEFWCAVDFHDNGTIQALGAQPYSIDYDAYGLKIGYELSAVSVTSYTSYISYKQPGTLALTPFVGVPTRNAPTPYNFSNNNNMVSEELLLNSKGEAVWWIWSAGGFYRHSTRPLTQYFADNPTPPALDFQDASKAYAVFGEVGQRFLDDKWQWTLGLRHFQDDATTTGSASVSDPDMVRWARPMWQPHRVRC